MHLDPSYYKATKPIIWPSRSDSQAAERYFQLIETIDLTKEKIKTKYTTAILGFGSDEGIKRNQGRLGASKGPQALRKSLLKLCVQKKKPLPIADLGNIVCKKSKLGHIQEILASVVSRILKKNIKPILLGGGHEIAWGHYQGIRLAHPKKKLGIINFDSHFDLRPLSKTDYGTSGTPFFQIAQDSKQNKQNFNYQVIGIQPAANTKTLFLAAKKLGTSVLLAEDVNCCTKIKSAKRIDAFIEKVDAVYVTFCLDVFAAAFAPGVSAPQASGIFLDPAIFLLRHILKSKKVICMDIAELSPGFDEGNKTANLAAQLAWEFLEYN